MDTWGTVSAEVETTQEALSLRSCDHAVAPPSYPLEAVTVNTYSTPGVQPDQTKVVSGGDRGLTPLTGVPFHTKSGMLIRLNAALML